MRGEAKEKTSYQVHGLVVTVVRPQLVLLGGGSHVLCRRCCRSTTSRSGPTWMQFLRAKCTECEVARLKADAVIEHVGASWLPLSTEGLFAMAALDAAMRPLDPGPLEEASSTRWTLGDEAVIVRGHRLRRAGPTV